jgi:hypothetical protein
MSRGATAASLGRPTIWNPTQKHMDQTGSIVLSLEEPTSFSGTELSSARIFVSRSSLSCLMSCVIVSASDN